MSSPIEPAVVRSLLVLKQDALTTGKTELARMYQFSVVRTAAEAIANRLSEIRRQKPPS